MKLFTRTKPEERATDYTSAIIEALNAAAATTATVKVDALSVVEGCVGLIADPFWYAGLQALPCHLASFTPWPGTCYGAGIACG